MQQKIRHKIICITNRHLVQGDFLERIEQIAALDWADAVILREKDLTEEEYKELAWKVSSICSQYEKTCILHTFADAAMELGYRKIHLPYSAFLRLDNKQRQFFQIIGVSTHTPEEAREAERQGASYVTASHIFRMQRRAGAPGTFLSAGDCAWCEHSCVCSWRDSPGECGLLPGSGGRRGVYDVRVYEWGSEPGLYGFFRVCLKSVWIPVQRRPLFLLRFL